MIVADTNVLSEVMRPRPDPAVVSWLQTHTAALLIPSIAIGELRYGAARLAPGARRVSFFHAIDALVTRFSGRVLSYDIAAANACGLILANAESAGRRMSLPDAQIAAIAVASRASLATRNVADFGTTGLKLINPWTDL